MALTPEQIEHLATVLVHGREQELIRRIREQLVGSLAKDGVLTATELHQAEVLYELNRDALTQILLEHKGPIADETKRAVWDILAQSHHGDIARLAPAYGMALDAVATANITAIGKQAAIGIARAIERANLDLAHGALESYRSVVEKATVDYIHSAKPTDKIIAEAVAELSDQVEMVNYVSGARARIDTAIRRILYTEVAQANSRMARARLDYYGHDLVITRSHAASRPDHFHWQGHVFSLTGRTRGYPTLEQGTDYGSVTGLAGANCRHTFHPWFEGDPIPGPGMSEEENLKAYENSQKQRAIERDIRATKREIHDLEGRGGDVTDLRLKLGQQQKRMREFIAETGLPRQPLREKAYGIGRQPRALTVDPRRRVSPSAQRSPGIPDIQIGRSVGAAAFRDEVTIPSRVTGLDRPIKTRLSEGSRLTHITPIAGKGHKDKIHSELDSLKDEFPNIPRGEWTKYAGQGFVDDLGLSRRAELHWYAAEGAGRVRMRLIKYLR